MRRMRCRLLLGARQGLPSGWQSRLWTGMLWRRVSQGQAWACKKGEPMGMPWLHRRSV